MMASDWSWNPAGVAQKRKKKRRRLKSGGAALRGVSGKARGPAMLERFMPFFQRADLQAQAVMPYKEYLRCDYWRNIRKVVLAFACYRCQRCSRKGALQVHHQTYQWRGQEHLHLECLEALCDACHTAEHGITALPSAVGTIPALRTKAKHGLSEAELGKLMAQSTNDLINTVCSKAMAKRRQVRFVIAAELQRRLTDLDQRLQAISPVAAAG